MAASQRPYVDADVHAFVDGQMDLERRASFLRALSADSELRHRVDGWRRQNEALAATFGGIVTETVPLRLMPTSLPKEPRPPSTPRGGMPVQPAKADAGLDGWKAQLAAVAIGAFLAGGAATVAAGALGLLPAFSQDVASTAIVSMPLAGLPARAYEAHQTYATDVNHPVEIAASDAGHLLKWLQHRLAMPVRIPDLRPQGWTLIGGRVLPGELGPAAYLVYGNGVDRLGLYMARTNLPRAESLTLYDNGAGIASVAYWVDEPVGYALTTSHDADWLARNGPALYDSVRAQAQDNASAL